MIRRPTISTRTDPLFPPTRLFRSTRAVGTTPVTQQSVAAKFGSAKASLPGAPAPASVPSSAAPLIDESVQAATSDWSERAAGSEEHTSELQSLMRISYAVFCLKKKKKQYHQLQLINIIQLIS